MSESAPYVRNRVYTYLRQAIVSGDLHGGARLVEDRLSEDLQVSRTPVREAIQRLISEGLVIRVRRGHVEVRHVDQEERNQLHELRLAFDEVAATLITGNAESIDWDSLYMKLDDLEKACRQYGIGSSQAAISHFELHSAINTAAFKHGVASLIGQGFLYIIDPAAQPDDYDPVSEHRYLLDELRSGDLGRATSAMRQHAVLKQAAPVRAGRQSRSAGEGGLTIFR